MATYTDNYNLTKPTMSELADIRVINGNMDTVDEIMHGSQVSIADAYDPTLTYDVDDLVMNDFLLYKCVTAVSTPEAFDPTKWERTTAVDEGGGGGNANERVLTQAEYNALTPAEKMNGTTYYIRDAVTPSAGGIDYSTTEQNTGRKWIDGKDVYQIVISDTMPTAVTEGTTVMKQVSAVSGIDTIVSMVATVKNSSTNYIALPYVTDSTSSAKVQYDTGNGYLKLYNAILNFNSAPINVIIQYTKTTSS